MSGASAIELIVAVMQDDRTEWKRSVEREAWWQLRVRTMAWPRGDVQTDRAKFGPVAFRETPILVRSVTERTRPSGRALI